MRVSLKKYGGRTHQGPILNVNEDFFEVDIVNNLYMIFDGFGGIGRGDRCVQFLKSRIGSFFADKVRDPDSTMPFEFNPELLLEANLLVNACYMAHSQVYKSNQQVELSSRAGASGIVAAHDGTIMSMLAIGNCRCLLLRRGEVNVLAPDHRK